MDAAFAMKPSEALRKARELITPEGAWTKEAFAKTRSFRSVGPEEDTAICWCASGALRKVDPRDDWMTSTAFETLREIIGGDWIADWNDEEERTHAEVLAAFDKAIALAEADGH